MNVLEEFWYGNLDPAEYDANPSKEYKELVRLISRNEEKLLATMTDEQKDLFSRYTDCVREHQALAECLLFQNSFEKERSSGEGTAAGIVRCPFRLGGDWGRTGIL